MNLLKSRFRRTTAVVAGAFIGLAGAVALVSPASAHYTELVGKTACLDNGGWKVDWTLTPRKAGKDGTITKVEETPSGVAFGKFIVGATVPQHDAITDTQSFDKTVATVHLTIEVTWDYTHDEAVAANENNGKGGKVVKSISADVDAPKDCPQPPTTTPGEPKPILEEDCTTITIGLENPKDGKEITLKFKTSKGEERTTVIAPGETKTEKFSAVPGFTVTVTPIGIEGGSTETITYEQPANCDTSGSGSGGGSGSDSGLPVTGAAAGTIAGGAGLLLALGGVLFFMARRRKVKFTA